MPYEFSIIHRYLNKRLHSHAVTMISTLAVLMFCLSFSNKTLAQTAETTPEVSPQQQLHSDLVLSALQLDFYNARCRGLSISRNFNQVNRLFVTKYSITANNYIKEFIAEDVREEKANQEFAFKKNLSKLGGCDKAKEAGWIKEIHDHFQNLYSEAEKSSWFPETP